MDIKQMSEKIEQVSKIYSKKYSINRDTNWFVLKLQEELGELTQSYLMYSKNARMKGKTEKELKDDFAKEVADVLCQTLLLAKHFDIDLEKEINNKWFFWLKDKNVKDKDSK